MREKVTGRGLTTGYLEGADSDDEDISIAAIKNKYKKNKQGNNILSIKNKYKKNKQGNKILSRQERHLLDVYGWDLITQYSDHGVR